uniref:Uncharacterized protein n=1 Tax=Kalanchoe fedtschenkoi TaxID=63787 RepID=A0A7N0RAP8_KALFE
MFPDAASGSDPDEGHPLETPKATPRSGGGRVVRCKSV